MLTLAPGLGLKIKEDGDFGKGQEASSLIQDELCPKKKKNFTRWLNQIRRLLRRSNRVRSRSITPVGMNGNGLALANSGRLDGSTRLVWLSGTFLKAAITRIRRPAVWRGGWKQLRRSDEEPFTHLLVRESARNPRCEMSVTSRPLAYSCHFASGWASQHPALSSCVWFPVVLNEFFGVLQVLR